MTLLERLSLIRAAQQVLRERNLLLVAAAGYGKTVLLRQLRPYLPGAHYLLLTVDDQDVAVLRQRLPKDDTQPLLIDDVHVLAPASESAALLASFLAEDRRRCVMAGRFLPFDATLLLAQGQAERWDHTQLAFTLEVTATLLDDKQAAELHNILHGWPIGVGLLQQLPPQQRSKAAAQDHLFAYLAQATFDRLSPELQHFLMVNAAPVEFSSELAAYLLGQSPAQTQAHLDDALAQNLFLMPGSNAGWFRYHDLVREFLLSLDANAARACMVQAARWHLAQGNQSTAVDHFFMAGVQRDALQQMQEANHLLTQHGRFLTFRRWLRQADPELLWEFPDLVSVYVNFAQYEVRYRTEVLPLLALMDAAPDLADQMRNEFVFQRAHFYHIAHDYERAITLALPLLEGDALRPVRRSSAAQMIAICYAEQLLLTAARRTFNRAIAFAESHNRPQGASNVLQGMAVLTLTPLGDYERAAQIVAANIDAEGSDYWRMRYLLSGCIVWFAAGDCEQLAAAVDAAEAVMAKLEFVSTDDENWLHFYRSLLHAMRDGKAENNLPFADANNESDQVYHMVARLWSARLTENRTAIETVIPAARQMVDHVQDHAFELARMALECDIVDGLAWLQTKDGAFGLSVAARRLIHARCRGELVRVHALLALTCHRSNDPRWRRRVAAVLRHLRRPRYERILQTRDRALGVQFWMLLLVVGIKPDMAAHNLVAIGQIEPLLPLLQNTSPRVRQIATRILARIGDERTMDTLNTALSGELDAETKAVFEQALAMLEATPPPPIQIQLMGDFRVRRGDEIIDDFHRPIVARLFQYFVARRGRGVLRDQILEDLWPDTDPEKAWATFRTVYSRLRNALEPHMRSKGPNRYFAFDGERYTFDPSGYVAVDVEDFLAALHRNPPLNELATLLEGYQSILPDLPYADWLLDLREHVQESYLDACLHLGQELLACGDAATAQRWAQRVIVLAPWMEAAYQLLMRAYARQNQRSRALRTYAAAKAALQTELAVDPSPLTEWLYKSLKAGEEI
ncbi:hypothetical protein GC175_32605 [bacterium]|nr:hypothetical protein [bacterium]